MITLKNVTTGIISDTQFPGHLDDALDFVLETGEKWGVQQWVHIGDMFDHHYMSRFNNELDAFNPIDEWKAASWEVQKWVKAIPDLTILKGNHDSIPKRQAETLGIPTVFLSNLNTVYNLPDTWVWDESAVIFGDCLIDHGLGSNGMYGCKNTANKLGCSYIQGHTHAHGGMFYLPRPFGNRAALNVGCLVDENKYLARYGKKFRVPVSLGMGIVKAVDEMYFVRYGG